MRAWRLAPLIALLAWLLRPVPVAAHARLLTAYPQDGSLLSAPPTSVHLWFSEPVDPVGEAIIVIAPSGRRLPLGHLHATGIEMWASLAARAPGTYLILWQAVSLDTHPVRGRLTFSVGHRSALAWESAVADASGRIPPAGVVLGVAARWLHEAGFALGFGPFAFALLILRPLGLWRLSGPRNRLLRLATIGMLLLVLAEPMALLAQTASFGSGALFDPTIAGDALTTPFGRVLAQRLGAAILLWVLLGMVRQGADVGAWAALAATLALALVDGQASHAVSSGPLVPGLLANAAHEAAMVAWIGGLASLLALWRCPDLQGRYAAVVARFGRLAGAALAILAASGALMALLHLSRPGDLVATAYGRTLSLKSLVVLLACALALAGRRAGAAHRDRLWMAETVALLGVLGLAGLLMSLPPPA
jgi:copper transport protein